MAKRLASEGYVVLLPNIYYRTTSGRAFDFRVDFQDPRTRQRFMELSGPLTPEAMEQDALADLDFLGSRPEVKGRMGVVGYCLTSKMAMQTAAVADDGGGGGGVAVNSRYLTGSNGHNYGAQYYLDSSHASTVCVYPYVTAAVNVTGAVTPDPVRMAANETNVSFGQYIQADQSQAWISAVSAKWGEC